MKHCVIFILIGLLVTSCIHGDYWDLGNGYSYSEKSICKQNEKGVDTLVLDNITQMIPSVSLK